MKKIIPLSLVAALSFLIGNIYASYAYNKMFHDIQLYRASSSAHLLEWIANNETDKSTSVLKLYIKSELGMYSHAEYESQDSVIAYLKNFLMPTFYFQTGMPENDKKEISSSIAEYLSNNPLKRETFFECNDLETPEGTRRCEIHKYSEDINSAIERFVNENKANQSPLDTNTN